MKKCSRCGIEKSLSEFYLHKDCVDGHAGLCKSCKLKKNAEWRQNNQDHIKAWSKTSQKRHNLKHFFGITVEQYEELLIKQNGVCAICGGINPSGRMLHVDHDWSCCPSKRSCGKCIRGLLCSRCNTALGSFKDNSENLKKALKYLGEN